jgi:hypothetical protein
MDISNYEQSLIKKITKYKYKLSINNNNLVYKNKINRYTKKLYNSGQLGGNDGIEAKLSNYFYLNNVIEIPENKTFLYVEVDAKNINQFYSDNARFEEYIERDKINLISNKKIDLPIKSHPNAFIQNIKYENESYIVIYVNKNNELINKELLDENNNKYRYYFNGVLKNDENENDNQKIISYITENLKKEINEFDEIMEDEKKLVDTYSKYYIYNYYSNVKFIKRDDDSKKYNINEFLEHISNELDINKEKEIFYGYGLRRVYPYYIYYIIMMYKNNPYTIIYGNFYNYERYEYNLIFIGLIFNLKPDDLKIFDTIISKYLKRNKNQISEKINMITNEIIQIEKRKKEDEEKKQISKKNENLKNSFNEYLIEIFNKFNINIYRWFIFCNPTDFKFVFSNYLFSVSEFTNYINEYLHKTYQYNYFNLTFKNMTYAPLKTNGIIYGPCNYYLLFTIQIRYQTTTNPTVYETYYVEYVPIPDNKNKTLVMKFKQMGETNVSDPKEELGWKNIKSVFNNKI